MLFSGTPCQIAGLKSFLKHEYQNLILVDIVCHGVSSPKVWEKYICEQEATTGKKIAYVKFRDKASGWKRSTFKHVYTDGTEDSYQPSINPYMMSFKNNSNLRPSCYACSFKGVRRVSDITLGDFWGVDKFMPELFDDMGTSLVFTHSECGEKLVKQISNDGQLVPIDIQTAVKENKAVLMSELPHEKRETFFEKLDTMKLKKLSKKYAYPKLTPYQKLAVFLQRIGVFPLAKKLKDKLIENL
ncbi:MAG: Coenzyme F420 hydrogenase/dehydrogenase, beta subunit C-terminal domain [Oscillospiraceae bacterium]|nr:Coenzyme F420 hydrogenase/dehydrogenase, beta subunit C-terminal domain [Oscillospiraceae bacterium]